MNGLWRLKVSKFLGWFVGLVVPVQEISVLPLAALVDQVQNIFFLTGDYFNSFVPIAQQAGQAAALGRLSHSMHVTLVLKL